MLTFVPVKRQPPGKLTQAKIRMADEIRRQLRLYGGAAHRDVVIDRIMTARSVTSGIGADRLRKLALTSFELHRNPPPESGAPKLFTLPFGEDSYRWALDRDGETAVST